MVTMSLGPRALEDLRGGKKNCRGQKKRYTVLTASRMLRDIVLCASDIVAASETTAEALRR